MKRTEVFTDVTNIYQATDPAEIHTLVASVPTLSNSVSQEKIFVPVLISMEFKILDCLEL